MKRLMRAVFPTPRSPRTPSLQSSRLYSWRRTAPMCSGETGPRGGPAGRGLDGWRVAYRATAPPPAAAPDTTATNTPISMHGTNCFALSEVDTKIAVCAAGCCSAVCRYWSDYVTARHYKPHCCSPVFGQLGATLEQLNFETVRPEHSARPGAPLGNQTTPTQKRGKSVGISSGTMGPNT